MEYAARVLAGEEELAPDYNDVQKRAAELAAMARPSGSSNSSLARDGMEGAKPGHTVRFQGL